MNNLRYLHVKQALADLAEFIRYQRKMEPEFADSKVILVGGSYAATMVVWFKKLYPDLVAGGWASSAPLFAKVDFIEYQQVVGKAIKELGNQTCYDRIRHGIEGTEEMIYNRRTAEFKALFKICDTFNENNDLDVWTFFETISSIIAGIVQYQTNNDIPLMCNSLLKYNDDVDALSHFWLKYMPLRKGCVDVSYNSMIKALRGTLHSNGE